MVPTSSPYPVDDEQTTGRDDDTPGAPGAPADPEPEVTAAAQARRAWLARNSLGRESAD